jgi:Flp pilus assembly pilin Flp
MGFVKRFLVEEEGAETAEWALMVVVLAGALLLTGPSLATGLGNAFSSIGNGVNSKASADFGS